MSNIVKVTLYFTPALKSELERLARMDDRSLNAYLVRLCGKHVEGLKKSKKGVDSTVE